MHVGIGVSIHTFIDKFISQGQGQLSVDGNPLISTDLRYVHLIGCLELIKISATCMVQSHWFLNFLNASSQQKFGLNQERM